LKNAWSRFWFLPADPTTLGLMRIAAGCVALYIHLAYSLELNEFFGPDAWLSQEAANRERLEQPIFAPALGWQQPPEPIRFPQLPHRRAAIFEVLRRLPDDPDARITRLLFLSTLFQNIGERRQFFTDYAALSPEQRQTVKRQLADKAPETLIAFPDSFRQLPPADAVRNLAEADALIALLGPQPGLGYFLDWFRDLDTTQRFGALDFIRDLPRAGTERADLLNYFEFWNADSRQTYTRGRVVFSPWFHVKEPATMRGIHAAVLIVLFLFTIGLWTRVTSVLAWLAVMFYAHRAAPVMFGLDSVVSVVMLYLMVGPSGSALSVDRLLARFRAARALPAPWAEQVLAGPTPSILANITLRLVQIHFCLIYASTGLTKVKGATWWNHSAGWMSLMNPDFSLVHHRWYELLLHTLAESRLLLALLCGSVVVFTIVMEVGLPILIWTSLRPIFIVGSILLHSGIAFVMGLTPFGLIMMTMLLAFFPASVVRNAPDWMIRRGKPIAVRFNPADDAQRRRANRLRALDIAGQVTLQPTAVNSMDKVDPWSLALLRMLRWCPGGRWLAGKLMGG